MVVWFLIVPMLVLCLTFPLFLIAAKSDVSEEELLQELEEQAKNGETRKI